jgi:hypothetical protein
MAQPPSLAQDDSSVKNSVTSLPPIRIIPPPPSSSLLDAPSPRRISPVPSSPSSKRGSGSSESGGGGVLKDGYLWKRTSVFKQHVWQKKWVVLDNHSLKYTLVIGGGKTSAMSKEIPTSFIKSVNWIRDLATNSASPSSPASPSPLASNSSLRFDVAVWVDSSKSADEIWRFKAEDETQAKDWVRTITRIVNQVQVGKTITTRKSLIAPGSGKTPPSSIGKSAGKSQMLSVEAIREIRKKSILSAMQDTEDLKELVNSMDLENFVLEDSNDGDSKNGGASDAESGSEATARSSFSEGVDKGATDINDTSAQQSARKKRAKKDAQEDFPSLMDMTHDSEITKHFECTEFQIAVIHFVSRICHMKSSQEATVPSQTEISNTISKFESNSTLLIFLLDNVSGKKNAAAGDDEKTSESDMALDRNAKLIVEICRENDMGHVLETLFQIESANKLDRSLAVALFWWNQQSLHRQRHSCAMPSACPECIKVFEKFSKFVRKNMKGEEISEEFVNMLLWMLVDDTWSFETIETMSAEVTNPGIWHALVRSLEAASLEVRKKALESILVLFINKTGNAQDLVNQVEWVHWFCALLEWDRVDNLQNRTLAIQIITSALFESFLHTPLLFDSIARNCFNEICHNFKKSPGFSKIAHRTIQVVITSLIGKLANNRRVFPVSFESEVWGNVLNISAIVTIFCFKTAFLGEKPLEKLKLAKNSETSRKSNAKMIFFQEDTQPFWGIHITAEGQCSDTDLINRFVDFLRSFKFAEFLEQPSLNSNEKEYISTALRKLDFFTEALTFLVAMETKIAGLSDLETLNEIDSLTKRFVTSKNTKSRRSVIGTLNTKEWKEERAFKKALAPDQKKKRRSIGNLRMVLEKATPDPNKVVPNKNGRKNSFDLHMLTDLLKENLGLPENVSLNQSKYSQDIGPVFAGRDLVRTLMTQGLVSDEDQAIIIGNLMFMAEILEVAAETSGTSSEQITFRNDLTAFKFAAADQLELKLQSAESEEHNHGLYRSLRL